MTEDEMDDVYVDLIGSIDLPDVPPADVVAHVERLLADPDGLSGAALDRLWADINDPDLRDAADTFTY